MRTQHENCSCPLHSYRQFQAFSPLAQVTFKNVQPDAIHGHDADVLDSSEKVLEINSKRFN